MLDDLEKEVNLLHRHLVVLGIVMEEGPIGIVKMAQKTDYPHHKIRYSLRVLEEEGLIEPTSAGAEPTDQAGEFIDDLKENLTDIIDRVESSKTDVR